VRVRPGLAGADRLELYQADRLVLAEETLWAERGPTRRNLSAALTERRLAATKAPPCPKCGGRVRITGGRAPLLYFQCDACGGVGTYNPTSTDS
jgi:hypothetical protein